MKLHSDFIGASCSVFFTFLLASLATLGVVLSAGCVDQSVTPTRFFVKVLEKEDNVLYYFEQADLRNKTVRKTHLAISQSAPNYLRIESLLEESLKQSTTVCVIIQNPATYVVIDICKET